MATATTYDKASNVGAAAANREDLSDMLTIVTPEETPLVSGAGKLNATAVQHDWNVDVLRNPRFAGRDEDADVGSYKNQVADRARLGNIVEGYDDSFKVSRLQQAVATASVADEVANSKGKMVRQIKRDIESSTGSDNDLQTSTGPGVPYLSRGLGDWISATAPSASPTVPTNYLTPTGSIDTTATASLTEDLFNGVIQSVYEQTGNTGQNLRLVAGPNLKLAIDKFLRADTSSNDTTLTVTQPAGEKKVTLSVNLYDSSFGRVAIVTSMFNGRATDGGITNQVRARGYLYLPEMLKVASVIPMEMTETDDLGGGRRGDVQCWLTNVVSNPLAFGKFAGAS